MPSLAATAGALAFALLPCSAASRVVLPARTTAPSFPFSQVYPLPTKGPALPGLLARQDDDDESSTVDTVLMAPDSICGYISGRPGASFFCPVSAQCMLFTAKEDLPGYVACCNTVSCAAKVTCMDYKEVVESSRCDDGCMVDNLTIKCTDSELPYCNTVSFSSDIYDYACNNVDISTPQAVWTTYQGQTSGRTFTPLPLDADQTSVGESGFARPTGLVGEEEEGGKEKGGDEGDGEDGGKKGVNAGAIAGGTVGGVAVIGALILGFLFLRRKKNQAPPPATPATTTTQQWTQPGSPQYTSPGVPYFKPGHELPNYAQAPDQNSVVSPRESAGYGYQGQYPQGVPVQGQQVPHGQPPPQGPQNPLGQAPHGQLPGQPMPELGNY